MCMRLTFRDTNPILKCKWNVCSFVGFFQTKQVPSPTVFWMAQTRAPLSEWLDGLCAMVLIKVQYLLIANYGMQGRTNFFGCSHIIPLHCGRNYRFNSAWISADKVPALIWLSLVEKTLSMARSYYCSSEDRGRRHFSGRFHNTLKNCRFSLEQFSEMYEVE